VSDGYLYNGLGIAVRETADGELYEFGVVVDGVFIGLGVRKVGDVQAELDAAKQRKSEQTSAG
jgi:hypothetical protein